MMFASDERIYRQANKARTKCSGLGELVESAIDYYRRATAAS